MRLCSVSTCTRVQAEPMARVPAARTPARAHGPVYTLASRLTPPTGPSQGLQQSAQSAHMASREMPPSSTMQGANMGYFYNMNMAPQAYEYSARTPSATPCSHLPPRPLRTLPPLQPHLTLLCWHALAAQMACSL